MSLAPTRFLVALGAPALPERLYLHVSEGVADPDTGERDGEAYDIHDWLPDPKRALRFATAADARAFGHLALGVPFTVTEHAAADLVGAELDDPDDEVDDLTAC